jgi:hypothetical protein
MNGVDGSASDAVRTSRTEYVTVQGNDLMFASQQGGYMFVHVTENIPITTRTVAF